MRLIPLRIPIPADTTQRATKRNLVGCQPEARVWFRYCPPRTYSRTIGIPGLMPGSFAKSVWSLLRDIPRACGDSQQHYKLLFMRCSGPGVVDFRQSAEPPPSLGFRVYGLGCRVELTRSLGAVLRLAAHRARRCLCAWVRPPIASLPNPTPGRSPTP